MKRDRESMIKANEDAWSAIGGSNVPTIYRNGDAAYVLLEEYDALRSKQREFLDKMGAKSFEDCLASYERTVKALLAAKREADSIHYGLIEAYLCMRLSFFKERRIRSDELDTVRDYCRPGSIDEACRKIDEATK